MTRAREDYGAKGCGVRRLARRASAVIIGLFLVFAAGLASAAGASDAVRNTEIEKTLTEFSRLERQYARDPAEIDARQLRAAMAKARELLAPITEELARAEDGLAALGPKPAAGAPAEAASLARQRAAAETLVANLRAQKTRLTLAFDGGSNLLTRLSRRVVADLYASFARQGPSLLAPGFWAAAGREGAVFAANVGTRAAAWSAATPLSRFALAAGFALMAVLFFGPIAAFARRVLVAPLAAAEATFSRRLAIAGVRIYANLLIAVVGGLAIIWSAKAIGLLDAQGLPVAFAFVVALAGWFVARGFFAVIVAHAARGITAAALALVALVGAKLIFVALARVLAPEESAEFVLLIDGVVATLFGVGLLFACLRPASGGAATSRGAWPIIRRAGRLIGVALIAATLAGYQRLADFVAVRIYFAGLLVALFWTSREALKEGGAVLDRRLRKAPLAGAHDDERRASAYWIGVLVDAFLLLALIPCGLALAGWPLDSVRDLSARAFTGVRIGGAVISVSGVMFALLGVAAVLTGTRIVQGALHQGPFRYSRLDRGAQESLITLIGYAGLVVALIVGVSLLGFNLSNLALIASALSVGVGLGLQGVVTNFVSGLILLFERPIKVGDWIVTQSGEGIVRKISVRSTEIETFERSSIIVPNSELVTSVVTNWTHRGALGRVTVAVGVSYDADPEEVRTLLLACAHEHRDVLVNPPPFVVWKDFGASSLDFELRAFLADIGNGLQVRTDLRFAIFKALKEAGIEIPYPQRVVHMREARGKPARETRAAGEAAAAPRYEPDSPETET